MASSDDEGINLDNIYLDTLNTLDETQEDAVLHVGVQKIFNVIHTSDIYESPIDINITNSEELELPPLEWHHMDLPPKKVKLTNTGHTVILSAKWFEERPYLSGGPFIGKYVFSQLHFHWGTNNMEGSEHTISGCQHPLEMHAVFFRSCYLTQECALKKKDGMSVLAYIFKLQDEINPGVTAITDAIFHIREPHHSIRLDSLPLGTYLKPFFNDYFLYSGSVNTTRCIHNILWLISRDPMGIAIGQVDVFRSLLDTEFEPLVRNFRAVHPLHGRKIYHVNPSGQKSGTLTQLIKYVDPKGTHMTQQVNKYPRSSKEYVPNTGPTIYRVEDCPDPLKDARYIKGEKTKINIDPKIRDKIRSSKTKRK